MAKSAVDPAARYRVSHEWSRPAADDSGALVCGISDHAQQAMGDLVYVELPRVGQRFAAGERFATVESVKAASDVYMPVAGTVISVNSALEGAPEGINADPYGSGWLVTITPADPAEFLTLADATAYQTQLDAEES